MESEHSISTPTPWAPLSFRPELAAALPLRGAEDALYRIVTEALDGAPHYVIEVFAIEGGVCQKAYIDGLGAVGNRSDTDDGVRLTLRRMEELPLTTIVAYRVDLGGGSGEVTMSDGTKRTDLPAFALAQVPVGEPPAPPKVVPRPSPFDEMDQAAQARLLQSPVWDHRHLLALGRILEVTASNDATLLALLGRALGLPATSFPSRDLAAAAFLGLRAGQLSDSLSAVAAIPDSPEWVRDAAAWGKRVASATRRRDQMVHRSPVLVMNAPGGPRPGLGRARRNQGYEVLDRQAVDLLSDLVDLHEEGLILVGRSGDTRPSDGQQGR